jgi:MoxR-like ATPase
MLSSVTSPIAALRETPGTSTLGRVHEAVAERIRGKDEVVELALVALVAGGHLLVEDMPGVGKSTLARALASAVGGTLSRIQFTSDLLPADIVGVNVWRAGSERFELSPGPIFANFVLADELNRAPPRTQSALLEAMGEGQVSIDGHTRPLPRPFMVLATQNPLEHHGTYPLPESQRDRFTLCVSLGYAAAEIEAELLANPPSVGPLEAVTDPDTVAAAQRRAAEMFLHADLAAYAQRVVQATREHAGLRLGVSTRGALAWVAAARARAFLRDRSHVSIDDLQDLAVPALAHRVLRSATGSATDDVIRTIVASTAVPR